MPSKFTVTAHLMCATSACFVLPIAAQTACVRGRVTTLSGNTIAEAHITLKNTANESTRDLLSDRNGEYQTCDLAPGQYAVTITARGFSSEERERSLSSGSAELMDIMLREPGSPSSGDSSMLEFRYSTRSSDHRNELPDAPSLERSKAELPHGHVKALRGSSISSVPSLRSFDELPASQLDAVLGGTLQSGEIGYSASFDGFAINRQQLLNALAVAQAKASKSLFGSDPLLLSTTTFNARIDHKFGQRDSFSTRFRHDDLIAGGARPANGAALPAITPNTKIRQSSASVSNSLDLTPNTINQTRAQFTVADAQLPAGTRLASIGLGIPGTQHDRVFEAATNIYRQVGGNSLKFGGDFLMNQASLAFVEKAGRSSISRSSRDTGLYVVSQRRMSPGLLLTSGLRYDIAPVAGLKRDRNSLAPQVGFAWSPASHTVIRGGGGMYYDQLPLFAIVGSDIQGTAANLLNSVSVSGKLPPSIGISAFNPSLQRTYVETANFGIEQHIGARTSISADYQFARGLQMMIPLQGLTSLCSSETECRAGSSFYATQTGSGAESSYHGISVAVAQEPTRWSSYTVSYSDATADSARLLSDVSYFGERVRRVGFTSVLHTSAEPASDLWQRFARGVALTTFGDYSTRSAFTGFSFVNMNARLTKTLAWGQHYRLDAVAETMNSFERTGSSFYKSLAAAGGEFQDIYSTYRAAASLQGSTSARYGLRLGF